MATKVYMEALSPTMEEGQVVAWLKSEGDEVSQGDVLAEIETDKATMELVARGSGILRAIVAEVGATAPVGEVIGIIASPEEEIAGLLPAKEERESGDPSSEDASSEEPGAGAEDPGGDVASEPEGSGAASATSKTRASPLARRLAKAMGVDLAKVSGTGPGGRVVKKDIEAAAARTSAPPEPPAPDIPAASVGRSAPAQEAAAVEVPHTQIRRTVARRLSASLGPVPHFFLTIRIDMTRVLAARKTVNDLLEEDGGKASINDFVIRAAAAALMRHPECNAWWSEDCVVRHPSAHIGVAVAIPDGLIAPVIRDAQTKSLGRIGQEVRELARRARDRKLAPEEYTGSTFSISNLGMLGIHEFTAVINPPEAAILAVGAVEETPLALNGEVSSRPLMRVTMSCDHRVIDGAVGARFLQTFKTLLEDPVAILA